MSLDLKHNSPLNSSSSKQLYSFPKQSRFPKNLLEKQLTDAFYQHDAKLDKKSFSFGKSKRLKTQQKTTSNQFFYDIEGEIQKNLKKKAGIKILYGRQECKSKGIFQLSENPGPGKYNPNPQAIKERITNGCSIGHNVRSKMIRQDGLPGPGAYNVSYSLLNQNKVMSSDVKKAYGKILFSQNKPLRISTEASPEIRFPQINSKGQYTFKKGRGFLISKSQRFSNKNEFEEPGPGSYKVFSQFLQHAKK